MATAKVRLNTDTNFLKLIAILAMLIDHLGARVLPQYPVMRIIGRMAFPLFAYCMAVGCVYTHNIGRYALRVALLALLVQPLYVTAMGHQQMMAFDWVHNFYRPDLIWQHYFLPRPSILFSLLAGILLIWTIRDKQYLLTGVMFALIWYLQGKLDYGIKGIALMVLFYVFCDRPLTSLVWVTGLMLWWGLPSMQMRISLTAPITMNIQIYALMALPLIYLPIKPGIKVSKYLFYAFYPAHLALIYLLKM